MFVKVRASLGHGSTLNRRRTGSPLVTLVEEKGRWEASVHPRSFSLKIGLEPKVQYVSGNFPSFPSTITMNQLLLNISD
ncbi:hypothetical protein TNCV_751451 [Trichonephila clavipes]|uniref:Uncharacterized protein n=1 Tax=Trichonephila clavipes TaxID=2585209 RepID=A0A8X6WAU7_TRICX|nr:hypothetical protein TNCV_751451 [Trichonephila clavipes]